ncbi:MAG TPA: PHP domain-containing protein [Bacillota bacterium]|nr:PHP domain-containing protein [Bacillota bacterium]
MYNIVADYHTHTTYSHGKGTILQNVQAARKRGLKRIAITDHGFGHIGFGVTRKNIKKMREEIDKLNNDFDDIEILLGVESNLTSLDGEIDLLEDDLHYFDIILMGFHRAVMPDSLKDGWNFFTKNALSLACPSANEKLRYNNTLAMIRAIEKHPIDIITHPGAKINIDTKELAKVAAKRNVVLEINGGHGFLTAEYAKIVVREGGLLVINSDAHRPDDVGEFSKGIDIAAAAQVPPEFIINTEEYLALNK